MLKIGGLFENVMSSRALLLPPAARLPPGEQMDNKEFTDLMPGAVWKLTQEKHLKRFHTFLPNKTKHIIFDQRVLGYWPGGVRKEYEERQYGATWWISTKLSEIEQVIDHVTEGLELLKRYREGLNNQGLQYQEKAPVVIRVQTDCDPDGPSTSRFILSQYMGDNTCNEYPTAMDESVTVEKWPPFEAYVRSFEGFTKDDEFISEARNVIAFLSEFHVGGYYHDDYYFLAGYDGSDALWTQRNEIWIIKEKE